MGARGKAERRLAFVLCAPAVAVMAAVAGGPVLHAAWLSVQRYDLRFPEDRAFAGFANYAAVLSDGAWWSAFGVTVVIIGVSVALELAIGLVLAVVMHRAVVGRGLVRAVALIPYGIVTVVAAYSWFFAWQARGGYLATMLGPEVAPLTGRGSALAVIILAEVWKVAPIVALLLMAGLARVPAEALRAAELDGAGAWQRLSWVVLPAIRPALGIAALFGTLNAFRIFDVIFVITRGDHGTASVAVLAYDTLFLDADLGAAAAMSMLVLLPAGLIALGFLRFFRAAADGDAGRTQS